MTVQYGKTEKNCCETEKWRFHSFTVYTDMLATLWCPIGISPRGYKKHPLVYTVNVSVNGRVSVVVGVLEVIG